MGLSLSLSLSRIQSDLRRSQLKSCKRCGSNRPLAASSSKQLILIQHRGRSNYFYAFFKTVSALLSLGDLKLATGVENVNYKFIAPIKYRSQGLLVYKLMQKFSFAI